MTGPDDIPALAIVVSRYNGSITSRLVRAAIDEYTSRGGGSDRLAVIDAPGVFELPAIAAAAVKADLYEGIVCLGCVIRGQTPHDQHIARACAHALADLSARACVPVAFGVITALDTGQAEARSGGDRGNKGAEAMAAIIDAALAIRALGAAGSDNTPGLRHTLDRAPADKARGHA